MGQGYCSGVVWGVASTDVGDTLFAERSRDLRTIEPDGGWFLWENQRDNGIRYGRDDWDDDSEISWCGAVVAADPKGATAWRCEVIRSCALADFAAAHAEKIATARGQWGAFRAYCRERADYDPGEGSLRFVRWCH